MLFFFSLPLEFFLNLFIEHSTSDRSTPLKIKFLTVKKYAVKSPSQHCRADKGLLRSYVFSPHDRYATHTCQLVHSTFTFKQLGNFRSPSLIRESSSEAQCTGQRMGLHSNQPRTNYPHPPLSCHLQILLLNMQTTPSMPTHHN